MLARNPLRYSVIGRPDAEPTPDRAVDAPVGSWWGLKSRGIPAGTQRQRQVWARADPRPGTVLMVAAVHVLHDQVQRGDVHVHYWDGQLGGVGGLLPERYRKPTGELADEWERL